MKKMNILIIVGSLRKDSMNKKVAQAFASLSDEITTEIADISAIPLFNQDLETAMPEPVIALKHKIRSADGIIIITPEYNRSIPGVLKNVLDWTSRPYGDNAWLGKPAAIAGATGGAIGTAVAQAHLRHVMAVLGTHLMGQPELYINEATKKFDAEGNVTDTGTKERMTAFLEAFRKLIGKFIEV